MADDETSVETGDDSVETESNGREQTPHEKRAERRRQNALEGKRKAEEERDDWRTKYEELAARADSVEEEKEKAAGEWSKLQERYERKLAEKDERIRSFEEKEEREVRTKRMNDFVDAIAAKSGVSNKSRLRALLREAGETKGVETSPEEYDNKLVVETIEKLKEIDDDTFAPRSGKSTPVAGQGVRTEPADRRERIRERARAHAESRGIPTQ